LLLLTAASVALNGFLIARVESSPSRPTLVPDAAAIVPPAATPNWHALAPGLQLSRAQVRTAPATPRAVPHRVKARAHRAASAVRHDRKVHAQRPISKQKRDRRVTARDDRAPGAAAPGRGMATGAGQIVRWKPVRGASYYNLVLWRDGRRVLDLWPSSSYAVVPKSRPLHGRLVVGRYLWFVYPGFGAKASRHYGTLAQSGTLVVANTEGD
jgi:hypothetical protein